MIFNSGGSPTSSVNIEDSIWADLQRLQLQLRQFQSLSEGHMKEMNDFQRVAKDDFQRLWDNVNELQEITNVTTKNMEDIYDKDVVALQDFRTSAEQEVKRLRDQLEAMMLMQESAASADEGGGSNVVARVSVLLCSGIFIEFTTDGTSAFLKP